MSVSDQLEEIYRRDSRRIFATLVRVLGSMELAEEALHDAFIVAAEKWPTDGVPANPSAWLVSTARFKAIDQLRRRRLFTPWHEAADHVENLAADRSPDEFVVVADDQLRLIFTCCHPSLAEEARIALTLREVTGLTTEAIAHACLLSPKTLAQRIVRAKAKIREAGIPYRVPEPEELPERLQSVLRVIYLVFNEGYSASSGDSVVRVDLSSEAIRLARLLLELLPNPEVKGLLALMLLHESPRPARTTATGDLVPLEEQDRTLWDAALIEEGCRLVREALTESGAGVYGVQAAISAVHAESKDAEHTDWNEIVGLYDLLMRFEPSPIIALNRAVALAMRDGPEAGLALIERLLADPVLRNYHLASAAKADLCRRLGRWEDARTAYQEALALTRQDPERRYLLRRLAELPK
jgi:RNA polymerase sigma-70 factor, ECF subfamily